MQSQRRHKRIWRHLKNDQRAGERERAAQILAKLERGEKLTDKEEAFLAYSPYGTGGGCASCAPGIDRPQLVKLRWQDMFAFGKDLELIAAMFIATR